MATPRNRWKTPPCRCCGKRPSRRLGRWAAQYLKAPVFCSTRCAVVYALGQAEADSYCRDCDMWVKFEADDAGGVECPYTTLHKEAV
jgi:hypothetical protein